MMLVLIVQSTEENKNSYRTCKSKSPHKISIFFLHSPFPEKCISAYFAEMCLFFTKIDLSNLIPVSKLMNYWIYLARILVFLKGILTLLIPNECFSSIWARIAKIVKILLYISSIKTKYSLNVL